MTKPKKKRKPRTDFRNNLRFDGSHMWGWPYNHNTPAARKLNKRLDVGLCLGCGEKECRCRSEFIKTDFTQHDLGLTDDQFREFKARNKHRMFMWKYIDRYYK